ncbi:MAG: 30S ribosomal protein S16 [Candidatus Sumerlaeota bacterium]|nr:30S ribosomal protein S16 [Candidatus Sumerlaeota bacterium]
MSVKIRLTRVGRRKASYFRIAVADSRRARDGRIIESIGHYQPLQPGGNLKINEERAMYWLGQGAIPSETIRSLFQKTGLMRKFHESKFGPSVKPGHESHHARKEVAPEAVISSKQKKKAKALEKIAAEKPAGEAAPAAETPAEPAATEPVATEPAAAEPAATPAAQ